MRIAHVVPTYLPAYRYGGPIHSVHALCSALAFRGHEVHLYTTNVDGDGETDVPLDRAVLIDGVNVNYFRSDHFRRLYWSPSLGRKVRKDIGTIDIMHLHSVFLWPTWAAARIAKANNVPYVLSPRGMLVQELIKRKSRLKKQLWLALIERRNIESAAAIHATADIEKAELEKLGFRLPPVTVIPNGVDPPKSNDNDEVAPDIAAVLTRKPMVLFIGRINWKKGLDRLIKAFAYVPSATLAIVGNDEDDYVPELKALAEKVGVLARVTFIVRQVRGYEKDALFRSASVLALTSYSENFGNVVLESIARGCPVLVTPEVGAADITLEVGGGRVANGAPEEVGKTLVSMIEEDSYQRMQSARQHVLELYSWAKTAERFEELYNSIVEEKSRRVAVRGN